MDDDDEIFNVVNKPIENKQPPPQAGGFDSGLGGFSFETGPAPVNQPTRQSANDDPFNILGL